MSQNTSMLTAGVQSDRGPAALGEGRGETEVHGGDGRRPEDRRHRRLRQSRHREAPLLGRIQEWRLYQRFWGIQVKIKYTKK